MASTNDANSLTEDEINNLVIGLRIEFGDTDDANMILQDSEYKYLISKYYSKDSSRKLNTETTFTFLSKLALTSVRERVGQEERYGNNAYDNYIKLLEKKLKDPAFGGMMPISYFGGTYRDEAEYYATDPNFCWTPFYQGSRSAYQTWKGQRIFKIDSIVEPYEVEARMMNVQSIT